MIEVVKELAPQLSLAVAIILIALAVARFVLSYKVGAPRSEDGKQAKALDDKLEEVLAAVKNPVCDPKTVGCVGRLDTLEEDVSEIKRQLASHARVNRKQFALLGHLATGQDELLEHVTGANGGSPRTRRVTDRMLDPDSTMEVEVPSDPKRERK